MVSKCVCIDDSDKKDIISVIDFYLEKGEFSSDLHDRVIDLKRELETT